MPVTCDPALVARMLRNLRSPCEEQNDNRRSLVEAQRTGRAAIVIIGLSQNRRGRTDDRVRPRSLYG